MRTKLIPDSEWIEGGDKPCSIEKKFENIYTLSTLSKGRYCINYQFPLIQNQSHELSVVDCRKHVCCGCSQHIKAYLHIILVELPLQFAAMVKCAWLLTQCPEIETKTRLCHHPDIIEVVRSILELRNHGFCKCVTVALRPPDLPSF